MKLSVQIILFIVLTVCVASCSHTATMPRQPLEAAEQAYAEGKYAKAQMLADSLMLSPAFSGLQATSLCRLSLLLMRLSEVNGDAGGNIAFAAHALDAAERCDSDSTAMFIESLPVDDRARLIMVNSITEGSRFVADTDSLDMAMDSLMQL